MIINIGKFPLPICQKHFYPRTKRNLKRNFTHAEKELEPFSQSTAWISGLHTKKGEKWKNFSLSALNPKRKGKNYIKNLFKSTTIMLSPDFQFIFWVWIVFLNKKFHWKKAWNILDFFFIKVPLKTKARKKVPLYLKWKIFMEKF